MEFVRVAIAIVSAVILGPKVEAELSKLIKPEGDFAAKAIKWGAPVGTGLATYAVVKMLLGKA